MFIIEILIYAIFALTMSLLAKWAHELTWRPQIIWEGYNLNTPDNPYNPNSLNYVGWNRALIYLALFYTLIFAVRWNVGSDAISYSRIFFKGETAEGNNEYLWVLMVQTVKYFGLHWAFGAAIIGAIQIFFLTDTFRKYYGLLLLFPFVFFGGRYWFDYAGAVRQMAAASILLWSLQYVVDRRFFKFLIWILIASLIHHSALFMLPIYLLPPSLNLTNRRITLLSILGVCLIAGQTPRFVGLFDFLSENLDLIDERYNYYYSFLERFKQGYEEERLNFGPMMLSYLLIPIFIIVFGKDMHKQYAEEIPAFNLWFNLAYLYSCLYFLFCNISHLMIRPVLFLLPCQLGMATLLLWYLWQKSRQIQEYKYLLWTFCIIIATNTSWDIYKNYETPFETVTYKTIFANPDQIRHFNLQ